ncbi:MAG TPA: carboxypeptidase M32 [Nevskiaceae bacterium]|nr:carboxypeptidase M32 [Nevskiaceae bacterium]
MNPAYAELERHYALIGKLGGAGNLLFWDRNVVMRPGSAPAHGEIAGALVQVATEKAVDPRIGEWLLQAEKANGLSAWQRANVVEMRRHYRHATSVPVALLTRKARHSAVLNQTWQKARAEKNFALFAPGLAEMVQIMREIGEHKSRALGVSPYDALIDENDPGVTCAIVDRVFDQLGKALPGILDEVLAKQSSWKVLPWRKDHDPKAQQALCEALMKQIGYDFNHGRLDVTPHPFAMPGVPGDVRITTRYKEDDLRWGLLATLHETGHSQYEFNLPREWSYQPVGVARGATLHESQSLMLEMMACRSLEFIGFVAPMLAAKFGPDDPAYAFDNVRMHYQRIQRNFIRVEADEVVYPLHVILRYQIERKLLDGSLAVKDLPGAWNETMKKLIGVVPPDDAAGCMQDVHWTFGMFGYFPNYALGAAAAAQLFEAATKQDASILPSIGKGDFAAYFAWAKANVHQKASSESLDQIMTGATGSTLSADALLRHLKQRYLNP